MRIQKTELLKNLLRELVEIEMALMTSVGNERQMLEVRQEDIRTRIRAGNTDKQIAA